MRGSADVGSALQDGREGWSSLDKRAGLRGGEGGMPGRCVPPQSTKSAFCIPFPATVVIQSLVHKGT